MSRVLTERLRGELSCGSGARTEDTDSIREPGMVTWSAWSSGQWRRPAMQELREVVKLCGSAPRTQEGERETERRAAKDEGGEGGWRRSHKIAQGVAVPDKECRRRHQRQQRQQRRRW